MDDSSCVPIVQGIPRLVVIIMTHRYWRIEQRHQQVLLDVADAGIALSQAGTDVFKTKAVNLPHPFLHKRCRVIMAANADGPCLIA